MGRATLHSESSGLFEPPRLSSAYAYAAEGCDWTAREIVPLYILRPSSLNFFNASALPRASSTGLCVCPGDSIFLPFRGLVCVLHQAGVEIPDPAARKTERVFALDVDGSGRRKGPISPLIF